MVHSYKRIPLKSKHAEIETGKCPYNLFEDEKELSNKTHYLIIFLLRNKLWMC